MEHYYHEIKQAKPLLATLSSAIKNRILHDMAQALLQNMELILQENQKDMLYAKEAQLSLAMQDRLLLNPQRIEAMASSLDEIAQLNDPVGRVIEGWVTTTGLKIEKIAIPIGVVATIYESRPNVTSDVAALCFKSGNVALLKGGKEAIHSNLAIASILQNVLATHNLPKACMTMLPDPSREGVLALLKRNDIVDLVVPRGGEALIKTVVENSLIPVIKHDKGVCHIYIDKDYDPIKASQIIYNAKVQRPSACNAVETVLIHENIAHDFLPILHKDLQRERSVTVKGCQYSCSIIDIPMVSEDDYHKEYLDYIMNIKIVSSCEEALSHIRTYGSGHSDAIITENYSTAQHFLANVDAACVYVNASTRFTDGGEFGFGAEVGISTNKLHARGPMGIRELTTYKYCIYGEGQIRQ